jgi:hypothetical protein
MSIESEKESTEEKILGNGQQLDEVKIEGEQKEGAKGQVKDKKEGEIKEEQQVEGEKEKTETKEDIEEETPKIGAKERQLLDIDIDKLCISDAEARKHKVDENIEDIIQSMETFGQLSPLEVRRFGDKYAIIAGQRRFMASKILRKQDPDKWKTLMAFVVPDILPEK